MQNETTFVLIKPDATANGLVGEIIKEFEDAGFAITYLHHKLAHDTFFWQRFYAGLEDRISPDQYNEHIEFMASGPFVALGLNGLDAVARVRKLVGATNPHDADETTIRRRFGSTLPRNAVHASDSEGNALKEAAFFFAGALMA